MRPEANRPAALAAALVAALLLAGCGSSGREPQEVGSGADRAWVIRPDGAPRSVVVFVHGLGSAREIESGNHLAWLRHLADAGSAVIYPAYETSPGGPRAVRHVLGGVRNGLTALGDPHVPIVGVGFSRGGRLVVEWAALQHPAPRAILSVFPAEINPLMEPPVDLGRLDRRTRIRILVGDRDAAVGNAGAAELLQRLLAFGFPQENVSGSIVRSTSSFTADHLSPLGDGQEARSAFWDPADELVAWARAQ